jgi:hypothetical protein
MSPTTVLWRHIWSYCFVKSRDITSIIEYFLVFTTSWTIIEYWSFIFISKIFNCLLVKIKKVYILMVFIETKITIFYMIVFTFFLIDVKTTRINFSIENLLYIKSKEFFFRIPWLFFTVWLSSFATLATCIAGV